MTPRNIIEDLSVDVLPAEHGDSILIRAALATRGTFSDDNPSSRGEYRILIDTGPGPESLHALRARLSQLKPQLLGHRWIDLVVFTHLDADHIGNACALLADPDLSLKFGDIWFNGHKQVGESAGSTPQLRQFTKSFPQAESVTALIDRAGLPLNRAFDGGPVVIPDGHDWWTVPPLGGTGIGVTGRAQDEDSLPVISLLSPTMERLRRLSTEWDRYRRRFEQHEGDTTPGQRTLEDEMLHKSADVTHPVLNVDDMARLPAGVDRSVANGSSIAFVLLHRGRQLLFLGDAFAGDYEAAYTAWRRAHPSAGAPDVVKVSHHGSRNNTTSQFAAAGAKNYLISTNGDHFGHPDDATLARLVADAPPGTSTKFWFNYDTPTSRRWLQLAETDTRFEVHLPPTGAGCGISLCRFDDA